MTAKARPSNNAGESVRAFLLDNGPLVYVRAEAGSKVLIIGFGNHKYMWAEKSEIILDALKCNQ